MNFFHTLVQLVSSTLVRFYQKLTGIKKCPNNRHDYDVLDEYMFYEFDDAHLRCKNCQHYKLGPTRQDNESIPAYLAGLNKDLAS